MGGRFGNGVNIYAKMQRWQTVAGNTRRRAGAGSTVLPRQALPPLPLVFRVTRLLTVNLDGDPLANA